MSLICLCLEVHNGEQKSRKQAEKRTRSVSDTSNMVVQIPAVQGEECRR